MLLTILKKVVLSSVCKQKNLVDKRKSVEKVRQKDQLSALDWHERFTQQAIWTKDIRQYILSEVEINPSTRILEVGSGTGAIIQEIITTNKESVLNIHGLDINRSFLSIARNNLPTVKLSEADAHYLPYACNSFHITFCHFFFLWISNPIKALSEMIRVTRPGGSIIAFAEPDYGGRIDYPESLERIGRLQEIGLKNAGANTRIGRQLRYLFKKSGLRNIQVGVLGNQWREIIEQDELESERDMLTYDLGGLLPPMELQNFQRIDLEAWEEGNRILYVPAFYAWGQTFSIG